MSTTPSTKTPPVAPAGLARRRGVEEKGDARAGVASALASPPDYTEWAREQIAIHGQPPAELTAYLRRILTKEK